MEIVVRSDSKKDRVLELDEKSFREGDRVNWSWLKRMLIGGFYSSDRIELMLEKAKPDKVEGKIRPFIKERALPMEIESREKKGIVIHIRKEGEINIEKELKIYSDKIKDMMDEVMELFLKYDPKKCESVRVGENDIDLGYRRLMGCVYRFARSKSDAIIAFRKDEETHIPTTITLNYMHIFHAIEMIADHLEEIVNRLEQIHRLESPDSNKALSTLREFTEAIKAVYSNTVKGFIDREISLVNTALDVVEGVVEEDASTSVNAKNFNEKDKKCVSTIRNLHLPQEVVVNLEVIYQNLKSIIVQVKGIAFSALNQMAEELVFKNLLQSQRRVEQI
jgi:phosphate uptake regulator